MTAELYATDSVGLLTFRTPRTELDHVLLRAAADWLESKSDEPRVVSVTYRCDNRWNVLELVVDP